MFNSPTLPSLTDVVVDPPDVAQQWRNFSENNANGKAPHRVLHSNAAGPGIHRNAKFTRSTDDMAVFHRVDGARLGTPCTLEVLGDSSTCSTVSTQNSPTRSGPCSLLGNFSVSNACRRDHQEELPSITSASHVFSPRSERGCVSASLSCTSVYQMREELERGETVAFNGLEEQPCDAPADGSTDVEGSGANPTEVATDASLGGYLLMLDHLRNLLYRHTPSSLAESPRTSLEINQVDGKVKVRDTAEALHGVPDNDGKETDVDESGSDELALGEDYSSELCVGDGSDDFGDAEEPTPAQRAEIEDTYRRFLANAEFLPHVDGFGCDHAGDAANADRSEVQLGGRGAEVSEQNGEGLG
uniref:Uncharacterized protein TCIL3000_10_12280 n=1 Tax=Trypanosoma congolense (strain IL3000) TaxID=1068625 RepID=G0UYH9_TRYCI|nr:unnamed protein product [Trypanosoma congolense IL3000]